jgi:LytS/YehU family sensor histidine kinase
MASPTASPTLFRALATGFCRLNWRYFLRELLLVLCLNFSVAVLWTTIRTQDDFSSTLRISNAIGFCIWGTIELFRVLARERLPVLLLTLLAIPVGFVVGSKVAALTGTADLVSLLARDPTHEWRIVAASLMIAVIGTSLITFYVRSQRLRADLQSERRQAAEALQSETSAKLALLQAQIEPHFLFNTLANVLSVIESEPRTAKTILEHLNQYLRVSLGRTRRASGTLADEIDLVRPLLAIAALRLGDRLRYSISVPDALGRAVLPPLLLQPLVENALKHGIEPAVRGGEIRIDAEPREGALLLRVADSGVGLDSSAPEGVGLANVRARLERLYGERGRLALYRNEPSGVVAELIVPLTGV